MLARILGLMLVPCLVADPSLAIGVNRVSPWTGPGSGIAAASPIRFQNQALVLPVVLTLTSLAPLAKAQVNHALGTETVASQPSFLAYAAGVTIFWVVYYLLSPRAEKQTIVNEIHSLSGEAGLSNLEVTGWRWIPLDYLQATLQLLKETKDDSARYDYSKLKSVRFLPWFLGLGQLEGDWIIHRKTYNETDRPVQINVVAHWHPRVFLPELKSKLAAATRKPVDTNEILSKSWTRTANDPRMTRWLYAELGVTALLAIIFNGVMDTTLWPMGGLALHTTLLGVWLALGGYLSRGPLAQWNAHRRGRENWVLDPAKGAPVRPASSLLSPGSFLAAHLAREMPSVPAYRSVSRPIAVTISVGMHAIVLVRMFPSNGDFALVLLGAAVVGAWSVFMTLGRLAQLPSGDILTIHPPTDAPTSPPDTSAQLLERSRQLAARLALEIRVAVKWLVPVLVILAFVNPEDRKPIQDAIEDLKEAVRPRLTMRELLKTYLPPIQVIPLDRPESKNPGQGGKALEWSASKPTPAKNRSNATAKSLSAAPRKIKPFVDPPASKPLPIPTVEEPKLIFPQAPVPTAALPFGIPEPRLPKPPVAPAQRGIGGQKMLPWTNPFFYFPADPVNAKKVSDPFNEINESELALYHGFSSDNFTDVDGKIQKVRLHVDQADRGWFYVSMYMGFANGDTYWGSFDIEVKRQGPQTIDIAIPQEEIDHGGYHSGSPGQSITVMDGRLKPKSMRVKIGNVEFMSGNENLGDSTNPDLQAVVVKAKFPAAGLSPQILPQIEYLMRSIPGLLNNTAVGSQIKEARIAGNLAHLPEVGEREKVRVVGMPKRASKKELEVLIRQGIVDYAGRDGKKSQWTWHIGGGSGIMEHPPLNKLAPRNLLNHSA